MKSSVVFDWIFTLAGGAIAFLCVVFVYLMVGVFVHHTKIDNQMSKIQAECLQEAVLRSLTMPEKKDLVDFCQDLW